MGKDKKKKKDLEPQTSEAKIQSKIKDMNKEIYANKKTKHKKKRLDKDGDKKQPKLTYVEDAFYSLDVRDVEAKVQRMTKHLENLGNMNEDMKKQIHSYTEERVDRAADLTRVLNSLDDNISKYNEDITVFKGELANLKKTNGSTIADLEEKYSDMHNQLTGVLKGLNAKLQELEDFRNSRDRLNIAIGKMKKKLEDEQKNHDRLIAKMIAKINADKTLLRKETEGKLITASEEFTRSSSLRNAMYAQRLIRENIALGKEIDVLTTSQESIDLQLKEHITRNRDVKKNFPALEQAKRDLILVAQEKTHVIENLTTRFEKLKKAYAQSLLYKSQYQDVVQYRIFKHTERHQRVTQAKKLASRAQFIKAEYNYLEKYYEQCENEIERLHDIIRLIKKTVLQAIYVTTERQSTESTILTESCELSESEMERSDNKRTLLETLLDILEGLRAEGSTAPSLDSVSPNMLILKRSDLISSSTDSLRGVFKHHADEPKGKLEARSDELQIFKQESKEEYIPPERLEHATLFDVEKGSSLYVSSVHSVQEVFEQEPELDDDVQEGSTSSSYDKISTKESDSAPTQATTARTEQKDLKQTSTHKMAPGTIVDVQPADGEEGEELTSEDDDDERRSQDDSGDNEEEMSIYMFY